MKTSLITVVTAAAFVLPSLTLPAWAVKRPGDVRSAKYHGGQGATWKAGRNTHGFAGSYGGCRYSGMAGPGGYKLNRSC